MHLAGLNQHRHGVGTYVSLSKGPGLLLTLTCLRPFSFFPSVGGLSQILGSVACQSPSTILGTLMGTAWSAAQWSQPHGELMTILTPTCWLSLIS